MNTLSFFNPRFTSDLFDVIDRNFSDFGYGETNKSVMPRVDVSEKKDAYTLEMELPGYTEKDVELNLKDRVLSISSVKMDAKEKKEDKKENDVTFLIKERRTSSFARNFTLPDDIDAEKVEAAFKNGLLTITIPRKAETQTRRIEICA